MGNEITRSTMPTGQAAGETGMIGAVAQWCECLHGHAPMRNALKKLAEGIAAEAVVLTRLPRDDAAQPKVVVHDALAGRKDARPVERSYARCVLGAYVGKSKAGTIWLSSYMGDDVDPALETFQHRRGLRELAIIPLASDEKSVDVLEIHYREGLTAADHAVLNMVASTLASTWANRKPGSFIDSFLKRRTVKRSAVEAGPILGMSNPARLSRAEFRVCLMLSKGLTARRVREELGICRSTLRTHLRNIYHKTETENFAELVYQLISGSTRTGYGGGKPQPGGLT